MSARRSITKLELEHPIEIEYKTPMKVEPVKVEIIKPPRDERRWWRDPFRWAILVGGIAIMAIFLFLPWLFFLRPQQKSIPDRKFVSLFISYPSHLAAKEEGIIEITVTNNSDDSFTEVRTFLIFTPTLSVSTGMDMSSCLDFRNLDSGEKKTKAIRIFLNRSGWFQKVKLGLKVLADRKGASQESKSVCVGEIATIPFVPQFRNLLVAFRGVVIAITGWATTTLGKDLWQTLFPKPEQS